MTGVPSRASPATSLTNSIAVVDQNIVLFDDTLSQNIRMWDQSIEDFAILMACSDAQVHSDIMSRPEGLATKVVRGGKNFSGGQCQRFEIATALAREPMILIMDEATSALDPTTEDLVMRHIREMGITQIVVAHRLSTIRDCDQIIVMDAGHVVQHGTHEQPDATGRSVPTNHGKQIRKEKKLKMNIFSSQIEKRRKPGCLDPLA